MGLISTIVDGFRPAPRAAGDPTDERYWNSGTSILTTTGIRVTPSLAWQVSCVVQSCRLIAETVGTVPLKLYRELADGAGKEEARGHFLWPILRRRPNPWQSNVEWRTTMTAQAALWPMAVAEKKFRNGTMELWPLDPDSIQVDQLDTGRLRFHVTREDGRIDVLTQDEVFRVQGFGSHRFMGANLLSLAREAVALWLAMEKFSGLFFWQGQRPGLVFEVPGKLDDEQYDRMQKAIERRSAGLANMHRPLLAEGGAKPHAVGFSPEESQSVESRQEQVREFARWFNIPEHMLHSGKQPNYASIEQFAREFVDYTIRPWCIRWESRLDRDLIIEDDVFAEHVLEGLLRGNFKDQVEAFAIAIMNGFMSENEVRSKLNLNPVPGLDEPRRSVNQDRGAEPRQTEDAVLLKQPAAPRRLRLIAHSAAARVVRRELATVTKEGERLAGDTEAWEAWVATFYSEHVAVVSRDLELEWSLARAYCTRHRDALLADGLAAAKTWETEATAELAALALEERDDA